MSLQVSMALSGIERDQWDNELQQLFDQGVRVIDHVRSSSSSRSSSRTSETLFSSSSEKDTASTASTPSNEDNPPNPDTVSQTSPILVLPLPSIKLIDDNPTSTSSENSNASGSAAASSNNSDAPSSSSSYPIFFDTRDVFGISNTPPLEALNTPCPFEIAGLSTSSKNVDAASPSKIPRMIENLDAPGPSGNSKIFRYVDVFGPSKSSKHINVPGPSELSNASTSSNLDIPSSSETSSTATASEVSSDLYSSENSSSWDFFTKPGPSGLSRASTSSTDADASFPSGTSGAFSFSGLFNTTGSSGGISGINDIPGPSGLPGPSGVSAIAGPSGLPGPSGVSAIAGPSGLSRVVGSSRPPPVAGASGLSSLGESLRRIDSMRATYEADANIRGELIRFLKTCNLRIINRFTGGDDESLDEEVAGFMREDVQLPDENDEPVDEEELANRPRPAFAIGEERRRNRQRLNQARNAPAAANNEFPRWGEEGFEIQRQQAMAAHGPEHMGYYYWPQILRVLEEAEEENIAAEEENGLRIIWEGRNILDLPSNMRGNANMFVHPRIPPGPEGFFLNRSQVSRLKGPEPPIPPTLECNNCTFFEPVYNY